MNDSKEINDGFKNGFKNSKKHNIKISKNRNNSKNHNNNKVQGLKLSRIEEFIEIGKGKKGVNLENRLLDTCVLKNIKQLLLDKNGENNKDDGMVGYTIDNKNKTIIKYNKSPNQLQIEQFIFPDKSQQKKRESYIFNFHNDSFEKIDLNNISENIGNINFIKKFKDNYQSDVEDNKNKHKKVKSNIIVSPQKLKKELKKNKYKNTVFVKHTDMDNILTINSKEKRKSRNYDKEKEKDNQKEKQIPRREESKKMKDNENNIQKEKIRTRREESKKFKDKDNYNQKEKVKTRREESKKFKDKEINNNKEEDKDKDKDINNIKIMPIRRKNKSKTRKNSKITFHLNKNMDKKNSHNFLISSNNIEKIEPNKKSSNNGDSNTNILNLKKYHKHKNKSNKNNTRSSLKSCYFENDNNNNQQKSPKSKKSKKMKSKRFQSVLNPKKSSLFDPKNKPLYLNKKRSSNIFNLNKKEDENSESNSLSKEKILKNTLTINSEQDNINNKIKHKKQKNQNNIENEDYNDSNNISIIHNEINKLKDYKEIKNSKISKNSLLNASKYKVKHENEIFVLRSYNKNDENKSLAFKMPIFSVVQVEKLISFECNRAYERPKSTKNFIIKKSENLINEKNNNNQNNNNDEESDDNQINKRNKSVFCCL